MITEWTEGHWLPDGEPDLKPLENIEYVWVFTDIGKRSKPYASRDPNFYLATYKYAHEMHETGRPARWWWMPLSSVPENPNIEQESTT